MSVQRANRRDMASANSVSAFSMPPRVSSEKTTPNPKVSSGALRSHTVIWWAGSSCFISAARYRPPGPPPMIAIFTVFLSRFESSVLGGGSAGLLVFDDLAQREALQLPAGVARQALPEPEVARVLVGGEDLFDVVLDRLGLGRVPGHAGAQH